MCFDSALLGTPHATSYKVTLVSPAPRRFLNLKMKSMVFEDSVFEECYFEDITSTNTFFRNCTFIASLFYNTGTPTAFLPSAWG